MELKCKFCDSDIDVPTKQRKFCSIECRDKMRRMTEVQNDRECVHCKKTFKGRSHAKFCTQRCFRLHQREEMRGSVMIYKEMKEDG